MKKSSKTKKLILGKATLRTLAVGALQDVAGGTGGTHTASNNSCGKICHEK